MTRIAVYGVREERDLAALLDSGADGGVFVCGASGNDLILPSTAKRLFEALPPCVPAMLCALYPDAAELADAVEASGLHTVLFHGLSADDAAKLRQTFPSRKLLRIFSGAELLEYSGREFVPFLDGCVLDTSIPEEWPSAGIGEWMTHSPLPVFFMGRGEFLEAAVAEFHPFGAILSCPRLPGGIPDEALLKEGIRRLREA